MNLLQIPKWLPAVALAVVLGAKPALAQVDPQPLVRPPGEPGRQLPIRPVRIVEAPPPGSSPQPAASEEPIFNIDFPGGTVVEFVAAVSAARGRPANILIDEIDRSIRIPPLAMKQVSLGSLMLSLNRLGPTREQPFEFNAGNYAPIGDPVWTLMTNRSRRGPEEQVKFFNLEPFLNRNTVEDITTALNAGYQLKTDSDQRLKLKFHEQTKLLMVRGNPETLEMVASVLSQLASSQAGPRPPAKPGEVPRPAGP